MKAQRATDISEKEMAPTYLLRSFLWMVSVIAGAMLLAVVIVYGIAWLAVWPVQTLFGD
jgi:hypothetical protein